ncbi:response regulator [candidate division KSB1 bacterium]|nr:response regulator [candidate division KSB1 bacterium]
MKILIIEDNNRLALDMAQFLSDNGFVTEIAGTFREASDKLDIYQYDLVVLDLGLPDGNGLELIQDIKSATPKTSILILTAKDAIEDKVHGLDLGADDYMTKPFHKAELNARIRSLLRRNKFKRSNILQINEIRVDFVAIQAFVNDSPLTLTRKEYDLLLYFMQNPDRLLTKESIAEHLWGDHIDQVDSFDFIYNHIKNLRKKITSAGGKNYIKAMYGMGYKFVTHK